MKFDSSLAIAGLAAALALSLPALAAGPEGGRKPIDDAKRQETQQKMKERVLEHIDAKIRILQASQSCVRAAPDAESMAVCHAQERKQTKDLRDRDRQEIQARKTERQGSPPGDGPR